MKTNKRIRILKTHLPFKLLRRVSSLSNSMLFASPSKFCLRRFFIFLTSEARFSALQFVFQVCSHNAFVVQTRRWHIILLSRENQHELCSFCRFFRHYHSWTYCSKIDHHLCRRDELIRRNPSQNGAFFMKSEQTIKQAVALSSPVSTVYAC